MNGKKMVWTMAGDDPFSRGSGSAKGRGAKASLRGSRRKVISVLSQLARIQDDKATAAPVDILKPLPIGDWRVAAAERRVAMFNGTKGG